MLQQARNFFATRDVLEVETPALSRYATMDPNIASISVSLANKNVFLSTSPEYYMKRLLAAGYTDIYQICRVYRDSESGQHHLAEFTMTEWYRLGFGLNDIISETTDFISQLLDSDRHSPCRHDPISISYLQAFKQVLELNPQTAALKSIIAATQADAQLVQALGDDRDAWLDLAMAQQVCKSFSKDRLTVIFHYPESQASLARQCPDNPDLSDRFEIYFGTLELANGFVELTDTKIQRRRFETDQQTRQAKELPVYAIDKNLLDALSSGIPQCAGVAVGLDRLLMVRENLTHIHDVTTFVPGIG